MTTLQDLITYVRQRTLMQDANAVSDNAMKTIVSNACGELYGLLVTRYEDYFLQRAMSALAFNQEAFPAPDNLMKIRAVDYNTSFDAPENLWYTINQFQLSERNQFNNPMTTITQPWGKVCLSWRLTQNAIVISPQNQAQGVYRVWYVPKFVPLVNFEDEVPANMDQQGWLELAVAISCVRVMNAMRMDSSMFETERAELKQRIISEAKNRQAAGGKRIANVRYNNTDMLLPTGGGSFDC